MKQIKTHDNNTKGFLSAIISGILTEVIAGEFFRPTYTAIRTNEGFTISSQAVLNSWLSISIILVAFLIIWLILYYCIPFIAYKLSNTVYQKARKYNNQEAVNCFREFSSLVKTISYEYSQTEDIDLVIIGSSNLFIKLIGVYDTFRLKKVEMIKKSVFGNSGDFRLMGKYLSKYEYTSTILCLERIINSLMLKSQDNSYQASDELKKAVKRQLQLSWNLRNIFSMLTHSYAKYERMYNKMYWIDNKLLIGLLN